MGILCNAYAVMIDASDQLINRVTHICIGKLTIIGSDNGVLPGLRQANIWTNAEILLVDTLGTNFNEIWIYTHILPFK